MYLYEVKIGDNEGCDNVESVNIRARSFDAAFSKAKIYIKKTTEALHRDNEKEKPEDRVSKSYAYTIEAIRNIASIDL